MTSLEQTMTYGGLTLIVLTSLVGVGVVLNELRRSYSNGQLQKTIKEWTVETIVVITAYITVIAILLTLALLFGAIVVGVLGLV